MKNKLYFLRKLVPMLVLAMVMFVPLWGWGQNVNIIPIRTDVGGFPTWDDIDLVGFTYLQLAKPTSSTISPVMNFDCYSGETLSFKACTFGSVYPIYNTVTVSISIDNGHSWNVLGTRTPLNSTLTAMESFDIRGYNGKQVKIKFASLSATGKIGIGIDDIEITGILTAPLSTISVGSVTTFGNQIVNTTSPLQQYTVSGVNLTADIIITPPAGFEVSKTIGTGFVNSLSSLVLTATNGVVGSTTIYARFVPSLAQSYTGNIMHTSIGASPENVIVSGTGIVPDAPIANPATSLSSIGFTANWDAVIGATSYRLDVATSNTFPGIPENFVGWTFPISGTTVTPDITNGNNVAKTITTNAGSISFPSGVSTESASASLWQSGNGTKYWQVDIDATGYYNLSVSSKQRSSNTGPRDFKLQYRIGSGSWVNVTSGIVTVKDDFTTGVLNDVLLPSVCDNQSAISIRWMMASNASVNNSTVANAGTNRIDDILIKGSLLSTYVDGYENLTVDSVTQDVINLAPNTTYYYRVRAYSGESISTNSNIISVTTGSAKVTAQDGDWDALSTWADNVIPVVADDVTLDHAVSINADGTADCHNLTIGSNGSLSIASVPSGTGSLITTGSVSGYDDVKKNITIQRYLSPYDVIGDQMFHFISSPVAAQEIQPMFVATPIAAGEDFYSFDEPSNYWINTRAAGDVWNTAFKTTNGGTDNFVVGKGYLVAYKPAVTKNFVGTLNSEQVQLECTNTGSGWNLLGNPFPSAIDWTSVTRGSGVDAALYYYDNAEAKYRYYIQLPGESGSLNMGQPYIPAMQGFMVHANGNGVKEVTIPIAAKTHSGQNVFYKSTQAVPGSLTLTVAANGREDEAFIHFNSHATTAFDGAYDAFKIRSYSPFVPSLFTKGSDDSELAINGLPELEASMVIPVYFEAATEGAHTLTANLEGLPNALVYLVDMKLNKMQNLKENPVYNFTASSGDIAGRFKLTFASVGMDKADALEGAQVYAHHGVLYIETSTQEAALVNVYNLTGQLVMQVKTSGEALSTFNASALGNGVYVVNVIFNKGVVSRKVVIRR